MSWEEMIDKWGEPEYGEKYFCKIKCHSKPSLEKYAVMDCVNEDDHLWKYKGEEVSNNWYHVFWIKLATIEKAIGFKTEKEVFDKKIKELEDALLDFVSNQNIYAKIDLEKRHEKLIKQIKEKHERNK